MIQVSLLTSALIPARKVALFSTLENPNEAIQCDVVFGSPSADCRGTGICKITGTNAFYPLSLKKECRITQAMAIRNSDGISLHFFRSLLCTQLYRRHFWRGVLTLEEPCPLPEALQLSLKTSFTRILPGQYQVSEENGWFRVDLLCD